MSVAAAMVLGQPATVSLLLGQMGALLTLLITAAWLADRHNRPLVAGVLLGVAIGTKPFLIVFVGYAIWRRSRPLASGMAAGVAGVLLVGLVAAGVAGFRSWFAAIGQISWIAHVANASLYGLLTRTLSITPDILHATPLAVRPELVQPLWVASAAAVGVIGLRALVRTCNRDIAWSVLLIGSLLVSPLGWVYYGTMFGGPLLAVAQAASRRTQIVIAISAFLLVPPLITTSLGPISILVFG